MPIYEYACGKCGTVFEELVFSAADEAGVACPACGAGDPERRLSACAAVVAGAGGRAALPAFAASGGCGAVSSGSSGGSGGFR
ncbi:MAG: zinc ribbon domain-containing protein [Humidesulfovibrio sp.]|nr:hypothetical protein [Desulfovibrio sp.]MDO9084473.1 zinc ribbon domain-containing protein [Humidesulfovibrio sp.]